MIHFKIWKFQNNNKKNKNNKNKNKVRITTKEKFLHKEDNKKFKIEQFKSYYQRI